VTNSLLLAIHFHEARAKTYLLAELLDIMAARVPPSAPAPNTVEGLYATTFGHFVKNYVLPGWKPLVPAEIEQPRANAADRHLLDIAESMGKPLITNEEKMLARAKARGVAAFRPREFWTGKLDPEKAARRFLARFLAAAPRYASTDPGRNECLAYLRGLYAFYRTTLIGRR